MHFLIDTRNVCQFDYATSQLMMEQVTVINEETKKKISMGLRQHNPSNNLLGLSALRRRQGCRNPQKQTSLFDMPHKGKDTKKRITRNYIFCAKYITARD